MKTTSPCLRRFFFPYGSAEAGEISGSIDHYLGGFPEERKSKNYRADMKYTKLHKRELKRL